MLSSELPAENPEADQSRDALPPRQMESEELLQGSRELLIRHGENIYRLRLTRNGKLILQK